MSTITATETAPFEQTNQTAEVSFHLQADADLTTPIPGEDLGIENETQNQSSDPPGWLTGYRRIPSFRAPRYNPEWASLTDSFQEALLFGLFFRGCQALQVSPVRSTHSSFPGVSAALCPDNTRGVETDARYLTALESNDEMDWWRKGRLFPVQNCR